MKTLMRMVAGALLTGAILFAGCTSKNRNVKEAEYVNEEGDTINPTEGEGEGTSGQKYMEPTDGDSTEHK